jgi:alpha-N-acetylgalactosaminidase
MLRRTLVPCLLIGAVEALDNGLARTPPMGWMTWERFRCEVDCAADPNNCINEKLIQQHVDVLAQPEWRTAGYKYVNIDDCWANGQRSAGKLVGNTSRFPSGMKQLADYAHSKGISLGTYNDMGTLTCGKYPGECKDEQCTLPGYMSVDAQTYAGWGIDSLKMDGCNSIHTTQILDAAYIFMGHALNKTGRPILYSCSWPDYIRTAPANLTVNYTQTAEHCNIWRMCDGGRF